MPCRHSKTPVFTIEQRKDLLQTWTNIGRGLISTGQTTYLFQVLNVASSTLYRDQAYDDPVYGQAADPSSNSQSRKLFVDPSQMTDLSAGGHKPHTSAFGSTSWAPSSTPAFGTPNISLTSKSTFGNISGSQGTLFFASSRASPFGRPQKSPMKLGAQNMHQSQETVTIPESALLSGPASENGTAKDSMLRGERS